MRPASRPSTTVTRERSTACWQSAVAAKANLRPSLATKFEQCTAKNRTVRKKMERKVASWQTLHVNRSLETQILSGRQFSECRSEPVASIYDGILWYHSGAGADGFRRISSIIAVSTDRVRQSAGPFASICSSSSLPLFAVAGCPLIVIFIGMFPPLCSR